jgi:hypothetical protein
MQDMCSPQTKMYRGGRILAHDGRRRWQLETLISCGRWYSGGGEGSRTGSGALARCLDPLSACSSGYPRRRIDARTTNGALHSE